VLLHEPPLSHERARSLWYPAAMRAGGRTSSYVIGIDVGGTFTDVTAVDESTGRVTVTKVPSRPRDEATAVLDGIRALGIDTRQVRRLVHGTTVGTNAVLERRGARVAVVTTAGFRDLLEIGRTKRNIPVLFVPTFVRPKPVVDRTLRFEVDERMLHDGRVLRPLDGEDVERVVQAVEHAGAEAVAVCLLHAWVNPAHERAVGYALKSRLPAVPVSLSSDVVPEYREFERFSTTVLNAYLQPLLDRYLAGLEERVRAAGVAPGVLTVGSSGGILSAATARRLPIRTIFSGPAGGVSQACFLGRRLSLRDVITYDMGGTSTDVCLVTGLAPVTTTDNLVGAFPVKVPQIDLRTVGAGGGSVAWLDVDGSLQVGPQSAGARPGPAAYGLGGTEPTVTDANVVLGRVGTRRSLGGSITLDRDAARRAMAGLAAALQLGVEELAEGIVRIAVARMTSSIREVSIQRGHDPRDFTLVAFGGAGPMHAVDVASELGIPRVLVPPYPGNFSALGLLVSDLKRDDVRTRIGPLKETLAAAKGLFAEMERDAVAQLDAEGFAPRARRLERSVDLRYVGQAFELNVPVGRRLDVATVERDFHRRHEATYGHASPRSPVELVNVRLAAFGVVEKPEPPVYRSAVKQVGAARIETRDVWFDRRAHRCPIYERDRLPARAIIRGPAIVEEFGATTVIPPHWRATVDRLGGLLLDRARR
jgi:N-methylhydantoinase A